MTFQFDSHSVWPSVCVIAVALFSYINDAHADVCDGLEPERYAEKWAVAPLNCATGAEDACADVLHQLLECIRKAGIEVMTPKGLTAIIDEQAILKVAGEADPRELRKVANLVPATFLVIGEVAKTGGGARAMLRLVQLHDGRIVAGTRVDLTDGGDLQQKAEASIQKAEAGDVREETVEIGLRFLADRLAEGYMAVVQEARYKKVAVLDFVENGATTKSKGLGRLIAAELVTRFTREHGLFVVERARLNQVMQEYVLAQQGVVDERKAPELGKMAGADAVIVGSVSESGTNFLVHAQAVDVESSLMVVAESVALKAEGVITLASEALVLRTTGGAIYRSFLLPGWGQLYNQETGKSALFGVAAGTFLVTSVIMQVMASAASNKYESAEVGSNFADLASTAENYHTARNITLGLLGVTWLYNILDAYINGQTFDTAVSVAPSQAGVTTLPSQMWLSLP